MSMHGRPFPNLAFLKIRLREFNAYRRAAKSLRLAIPIGIAKAAAVPRPRRQSLCA